MKKETNKAKLNWLNRYRAMRAAQVQHNLKHPSPETKKMWHIFTVIHKQVEPKLAKMREADNYASTGRCNEVQGFVMSLAKYAAQNSFELGHVQSNLREAV